MGLAAIVIYIEFDKLVNKGVLGSSGIMRHAYLIIAHNGWEQLKILLQKIDGTNRDIYIHIDKKSNTAPISELKEMVKKSHFFVFQEYKVYWGSFELVQVELLLFKESHKRHYDYYHLISGADLPIKSMNYIDDFFERNNGFEFVHYDTDERLINDKEIFRRVKLFHFLQNYRRRYKFQIFNSFFTFLERILLTLQIVFRVDRMEKVKSFDIKYGSQWISVTDSLIEYILSQEQLIYKVFRYTNCADELFVQSLVYNSKFVEKLYDKQFDDSPLANMRQIDIKVRGKNGNPYIWRKNDLEELIKSPCLFARKFSLEIDSEVVKEILNYNIIS